MNYTLIHNETEFHKFINLLPELKENEGYFLILVARAKWRKETGMKSAAKLVRETANNKKSIYHIIKRWEIVEGSYRENLTKDDAVVIHPHNLGVYIGYNPKDQLKAAGVLAKECINALIAGQIGINVKSMANDVIQESNGTKNFLDIDVDIKEGENYLDILEFIQKTVGKENTLPVKTNGGMHCLIKIKNLKGNNEWHQTIANHTFKSELNMMSHDLMPVPGCNQGPFVPFIIE